jgi:hypothetical protein
MKTSLDEYTRNARLKPAFLVVLPAALTLAVFGFRQSATEGTLLGLASSLGFTFLLAQMVRDRGKERQQQLFDRWGGKPTTRMLRHGDAQINSRTRTRYHAKLTGMLPHLRLPNPAQELEDPIEADIKYASCVDFLIAKTRDNKRFRLLFEENMSYGFRRNLWAMKPAGIAMSLVCLGALVLMTVLEARSDAVPWFANLTAASIIAMLLVWWCFRITPAWVKAIADEYALRLLASIDELEG